MAKGPLITEAIEARIAEVWEQYPKWKAPEIRNEVSRRLRKDNSNLPTSFPGLSIVQRKLAVIRENAKHPNPLDKPFSLGAVFAHKIPAEAIPILLKILEVKPITIREARWAAKLYIAFENYHKVPDKDGQLVDDGNNTPELLYPLASTYALYEHYWELINTKTLLDTSEQDRLFLMPIHEITEEVREKITKEVKQARKAYAKVSKAGGKK